MLMRKLYLVRHATPNFPDGKKLCIGRTDIDIGEKGIKESEKLRKFFSDKKIGNIFSSPLSRCVSTAKILSNNDEEIVLEDGLMEIYMGAWEGVPLKGIVKELGDEPSDGEKREDALKRFEYTLINILEKTEGDVICVSHAGVNCAFVAKILGKDVRTSRALRQPYACYNCFEFENGSFKCLEYGIVPED